MHRTGFLGDEAPSMIVLTMIHRLIIPFIVGGSLEECTRRGSEAMAFEGERCSWVPTASLHVGSSGFLFKFMEATEGQR